MSFSLQEYMKECVRDIENELNRIVPSVNEPPSPIYEAMRYSLFAGGKRIRPILTIAVVETLGGSRKDVLPIACAIESIHTYSLIHDDLPAMDNDDYRRGKLTNHKVFGAGIATLAGDALLTHAFQILSQIEMPGREKELLMIIHELAKASGAQGMIGGQVADLKSEGKEPDESTLLYIHKHKTGDLLTASVRIGAIFAHADQETLNLLSIYADHLGLAFQIQDDILDVVGDETKLGKSTGADAALNKMTYPALYGVESSREQLNRLTEKSLSALDSLPYDTSILESIASFLLNREY